MSKPTGPQLVAYLSGATHPEGIASALFRSGETTFVHTCVIPRDGQLYGEGFEFEAKSFGAALERWRDGYAKQPTADYFEGVFHYTLQDHKVRLKEADLADSEKVLKALRHFAA